MKNTNPSEVPSIVQGLRVSFSTGKTKSKSWRKTQLFQLKKLLSAGEPLLSSAVKTDLNKHPMETFLSELQMIEHEIDEAINHLDEWMADDYLETDFVNLPGVSLVHKDPLGVVLIMSPWNYPVQLLLGPLVGAIAAGNAVLLRPGEYSSATSQALSQLVNEYLDSSIQIVTGGIELNKALLKEKFDYIFFTGGTNLGKIVASAAASTLTPYTLELGGKSPCIIHPSVNLQIATTRLLWGSLMNSGQTCIRPDYVCVHESIADKFYQEAKAVVRRFYGEDAKASPYFGRMITEDAAERVSKVIESNRNHIVFGGQFDKSSKYVEPTVFDFGNFSEFSKSSSMSCENFGPVLPCVRYSDLNDVISFINSRDKPLALYCFSSCSKTVDRILNDTSSGSFCVNDVNMQVANTNLPFGGVGLSGMGKYHGRHSFDTFTHTKSVLKKTNFFDLPIRYAPYTPNKESLAKFLLATRSPWISRTIWWVFQIISSLAGFVSFGWRYIYTFPYLGSFTRLCVVAVLAFFAGFYKRN